MKYQLCPKCNGDGHLGRYNSPNVSSNICPQCDVCFGSKVLLVPDNQSFFPKTDSEIKAYGLLLKICKLQSETGDWNESLQRVIEKNKAEYYQLIRGSGESNNLKSELEKFFDWYKHSKNCSIKFDLAREGKTKELVEMYLATCTPAHA